MKRRQKNDPQTLITAVEKIKTLGERSLGRVSLNTLRSFFEDKGFNLKAVSDLAKSGRFSQLFTQLVLRQTENEYDPILDSYPEALEFVEDDETTPIYRGQHDQNERIDFALANSSFRDKYQFLGGGVATYFDSNASVPNKISGTPIAIIGCGAAGLMIHHALRNLGFNKVSVFEKAKPLGIWSQPNVHGLSRNNPRTLRFYRGVLESAPGDGESIKVFLEQIFVEPTRKTVTQVIPGNLEHTIVFEDGTRKKFPIVINAIGIGSPKPISDKRRMVTSATAAEAGSRWQKVLKPEEVKGKTIILIGLGNSTAEMLHQIHTLQDRGVKMDYRILTHYPADSVFNPNNTVIADDESYRVFRDLSIPELVNYQGDLVSSRSDYYRALLGGKILHGVNRWEVEGDTIAVYRGTEVTKVPYDRIMTLIGYKNSREVLENMGCMYDEEHEGVCFDYDGELSLGPSNNPEKRLRKGYYGFGSVLETTLNPNAIVIPGMIHRIGDLLFGIAVRSTEYKLR